MSKEPHGFLGFERGSDGRISSFSLIPNQHSFDVWLTADEPSDSSKENPDSGETSVEPSDKQELHEQSARLIDRFKHAMISIQRLIQFTKFIMPAMHMVTIDGKLSKYASDNLERVLDSPGKTAFSFARDQLDGINNVIREYVELRMGHEALPKAILLSLVATFD